MVNAIIGGYLIAVAASFLMFTTGNIAGFSGIIKRVKLGLNWRLSFILGLLTSSTVTLLIKPELFSYSIDLSWPVIIISALLVGIGTRLSNGCTSGHGVCGLARLSKRSLYSVLIFMLSGAVVATTIGAIK